MSRFAAAVSGLNETIAASRSVRAGLLDELREQVKKDDVAGDTAKLIRRRVLGGRGSSNSQMPPYAESTKDYRRRLGLPVGRRTLSVTGTMLRAMVGGEIDGEPAVVVEDRGHPDSSLSTLELALLHHKGTSGANDHIPATKFFGLTSGERALVMRRMSAVWDRKVAPKLLDSWRSGRGL